MRHINEEKPVSLSEQKKTLRLLLQTAKYSKNPHELLKYVPMLKISIQEAEIRQKKKPGVKNCSLSCSPMRSRTLTITELVSG